MYKRIAVAYDESPESRRALRDAVGLAKALGVGLQSISVMEKLPAYTAYATGADPSITAALEEDRQKFYEKLQADVRAAGQREEIEIVTHVVDGDDAEAIVKFVCEHKIDLLVIGIHRRQALVSRMWSTVYTIAQNVPCSVLGVH